MQTNLQPPTYSIWWRLKIESIWHKAACHDLAQEKAESLAASWGAYQLNREYKTVPEGERP
jgi:hypothetical protein